MPAIRDRYNSKYHRVGVQSGRGKPTKMPNWMTEPTGGHTSYYSVSISPSAPTTAFSSGSSLIYDLEPSDAKEIKSIYLRLTISASGGDVQLPPASHLFERITLSSNRGIGDEFFRCYPINVVLWYYMTMTTEQREQWLKLGNAHVEHFDNESLDKYWYNNNSSYLRNGDSRDFYIPIPMNLFQMGEIDLRHISQPIRFKIELASGSDVALSGAVGNLSLDAVDMIIQSHEETAGDEEIKHANKTAMSHSYIYLDTEQVCVNDKSQTAGSVTKYNLDSINGAVASLVVLIKGSTNPVGSDRFDYYEIGDGSLDVETAFGKSLYGQGNPVKIGEIYKEFAEQTTAHPLQGVHLINYSENLKKAYAGGANGFQRYSGQKDVVAVEYGAVGTAEVHTIAVAEAAISGNYSLAVNGAVSDVIEFDDAVGVQKSQYELLDEVANKNYSATFSANFDAGASATITYDANRDGRVSNEIGVPRVVSTLKEGSSFIIPPASSSVTTYGKKGWATSSSRQVEVYALLFKEITIEKDGKICCRNL